MKTLSPPSNAVSTCTYTVHAPYMIFPYLMMRCWRLIRITKKLRRGIMPKDKIRDKSFMLLTTSEVPTLSLQTLDYLGVRLSGFNQFGSICILELKTGIGALNPYYDPSVDSA